MKIASKYFTDEQKNKVAQAVQAAESTTSAEIMPVVATSSGRYDRIEDIVGLVFGVLTMISAWFLFQNVRQTEGSWESPLALGIWTLVALVISGYLLGVVLASRIGEFRRLFTPKKHMHDEVNTRARQIFLTIVCIIRREGPAC